MSFIPIAKEFLSVQDVQDLAVVFYAPSTNISLKCEKSLREEASIITYFKYFTPLI